MQEEHGGLVSSLPVGKDVVRAFTHTHIAELGSKTCIHEMTFPGLVSLLKYLWIATLHE